MTTKTNYYDGPGIGLSAFGQAIDSVPSPITVTFRPTGAMVVAGWGLSTISAAVSAYHGYKRNRGDLGWTLAWFLGGAMLPVVVPVIAFTQGFARPGVTKNRSGRKSRRRSR